LYQAPISAGCTRLASICRLGLTAVRSGKPATGCPVCTSLRFSLVRHLQPPRRTYKHVR